MEASRCGQLRAHVSFQTHVSPQTQVSPCQGGEAAPRVACWPLHIPIDKSDVGPDSTTTMSRRFALHTHASLPTSRSSEIGSFNRCQKE
ncbi:Hypothetical protein NTJ_02236 [Nesidiocoris tenuis]|uniref:Uncharacterized protein n=1 Tax=Nesidiocoris tenuis TaxID=355587 RepID=A0ABN7AAU6_9HEMI|nr:Hypothetical protein NTJ_02236 [Nesidiocoris tenuis]